MRIAHHLRIQSRAHVRVATALCAFALVAGSLGCAFGEIRWSDPLQREISLEYAQNRYTVLVRWSNFEKAAGFVDPELRDAFLAGAPSLREFRFTEYESQPFELDDARTTATVEVTYYAYLPSSPVEQEVRETQVWYREEGVGNNWRVRPTFHGLDLLLPATSAGR